MSQILSQMSHQGAISYQLLIKAGLFIFQIKPDFVLAV
jgi:hypothetical protein